MNNIYSLIMTCIQQHPFGALHVRRHGLTEMGLVARTLSPTSHTVTLGIPNRKTKRIHHDQTILLYDGGRRICPQECFRAESPS